MKRLFVFLFLVNSCYAVDWNEIPRFYKAMEQFDFPEYKFGAGGISLWFNYNERLDNNTSKPNPDIPYNTNTNQSYYQNFNGNGDANYKIKKMSKENSFTNNLIFSFDGSQNETGDISTNDLNGYYDTSSRKESYGDFTLDDDFEVEKYFNIKKSGQNPFVKLNVAVSGTYLDSRVHRYNSDNNYFSSNYSKTKIYTFLLNVIPSIGFGKRKPIYPIYQSFEIERKLKQSGALKGKLSDQSIQSLAAVIVSSEKITSKHTRPYKYIVCAIDSVLRNDSNVSISKLDGFVYGKISEAFWGEGRTNFDYGIRSGFELTNDSNRIVSYFRNESQDAPDSSMKKFYNPDRLNIYSECTVPLYKRLFFEYKVSIPIFDRSGFTALDSGSLHLGLIYFITDKFWCNASVGSLPLKNLVPSGERPGVINAELRYFLEDRVSVNLRYSNWYSKTAYGDLPGSKMNNTNYLYGGVSYVY